MIFRYLSYGCSDHVSYQPQAEFVQYRTVAPEPSAPPLLCGCWNADQCCRWPSTLCAVMRLSLIVDSWGFRHPKWQCKHTIILCILLILRYICNIYTCQFYSNSKSTGDAEHADNNQMYIFVHLKNLFKSERMASGFSCVKDCKLQMKAVQLGTGVQNFQSINDMMTNNSR